MVFSSIPFLFFFMPICFILYYAVPYQWKNYLLLGFSLLFYAWGEPVYIFLMLFTALVDYTNGRLIGRFGADHKYRRCFLISSVVIDLAVLAFFKYADFAIENVNYFLHLNLSLPKISLPVGISFFTFQSLSYVIDLYRGEVAVEKNYFRYLTYVSMFPQLVAGPIVRFSAVQQELSHRKIEWEKVQSGFLRFLLGLYKKVLIANQIGVFWEEIQARGAGQISTAAAWMGAAAFTLQLYFDFSAYSDMAIGMGQMLGFHFSENFCYPLSAVSITDFWRRWHISLSGWFRDYVYIPLGGNRVTWKKHICNIMIVWFLTGLWHGASWNFIFWGLYYGVLLLLEKYVWGKYLERFPKILKHIYSIFIVITGFVIFALDQMGELTVYLKTMFLGYGTGLFGPECLWYLHSYGWILVVACVLSFPVYPWIQERLRLCCEHRQGLRQLVSFVNSVSCLLLFFLTVAFLVSDTYNPFLYFRF